VLKRYNYVVYLVSHFAPDHLDAALAGPEEEVFWDAQADDDAVADAAALVEFVALAAAPVADPGRANGSFNVMDWMPVGGAAAAKRRMVRNTRSSIHGRATTCNHAFNTSMTSTRNVTAT
jgi:hypothetical protein